MPAISSDPVHCGCAEIAFFRIQLIGLPSPFVSLPATVEIACEQQAKRCIEMCLGEVGLQGDRAIEARQRLLEAVQFPKRVAAIGIGFGKVWPQSRSHVRSSVERFFEALQFLQGIAAIGERFGKIRPQCNGAIVTQPALPRSDAVRAGRCRGWNALRRNPASGTARGRSPPALRPAASACAAHWRDCNAPRQSSGCSLSARSQLASASSNRFELAKDVATVGVCFGEVRPQRKRTIVAGQRFVEAQQAL